MSRPIGSLAYALLLVFGGAWATCAGQNYRPLCNQGSQRFQATSRTHVEVTVAPPESGGFGQHSCRADLKWDQQSLVVADQTAEIDLDLFDVDLDGLGAVAAFQVKESAGQCCSDYRIYALEKPVHLLRTLRGGYFVGVDTDLDGRVEIWAEDRAAIEGLDGLNQAEIKHPPTYVLRFEQGRLLDTSAAFQNHFDQVIADVRAAMSPDSLKLFRESDGILPFSAGKLDQWRQQRTTKIQVLEIVWAYLYSGREPEAWKALHDMWPAADAQRIQTLLAKARSNGISTQLEGLSRPPMTTKHAQIFADTEPLPLQPAQMDTLGIPDRPKPERPPARREGTRAQVISIWRLPPSNPNNKVLSGESEVLDLVIDSAGKVRSVKWTDRTASPDRESLAYALDWKFIPAHRYGHSVASRLRFAVSLKR